MSRPDIGAPRENPAMERPRVGLVFPQRRDAREVAAAGLHERYDVALLGGDLDAAAVAALRRRLGGELRVASPAATVRRPAYLAELGLWRLLTEPPADPAALQPIYLSRGAVP